MILNDVLYSEGYFRDGNGVARNIIEEVMHISTLPDFRDSEQYRGLLEFIEEHVEQLYAGRHLREKGQELVRVAAGLGIPDNPFRTSKWLSFCSPSPLYEAVERESAERLTAQGYKLVTIYSLPQSVNYKFAKDEGGEQYFIHRSAFRGDQETGWLSLGVGAYVAVRADEGAREEGQALRVIEARPI